MSALADLSTTFLIAASVACATVITDCVSNCTDKVDGDYNSCDGCEQFVKCSGGTLTRASCLGGTYFDQVKRLCDWQSDTCTEIESEDTTQTNQLEELIRDALTVEPIYGRAFHFIKVRYHAEPCQTGASAFRAVTVRSRIDCGVNCHSTADCEFFLYRGSECLEYNLTSPPCFQYIYKYNY